MFGIPKSRNGWLSLAGLAFGGALIIICILKTASSASDRYWPLLAVGFPLVCVAAPFYYYSKDRDQNKDEFGDAGVQALNAAGKEYNKPKKPLIK